MARKKEKIVSETLLFGINVEKPDIVCAMTKDDDEVDEGVQFLDGLPADAIKFEEV